MDEIERCILVKPEVFVYKIPPRASARGYRAANWNLATPDFTGRLRTIVKGEYCEIRLEDKSSGKLFAACPIEKYPGTSVEAVMDSSRYFVLCVQDSGRKAYLGIGFTDRSDSFDLNVSLQDHFKRLRREEAESTEPLEEEGSTVDLSLKEGQTFRINIPKKEGGFSSGPTRNRPKGTGILPPPSSGPMKIAPPPGATPIQSPTEPVNSVIPADLVDVPPSTNNDDDWGEFEGGNSTVQSSGNWVQF